MVVQHVDDCEMIFIGEEITLYVMHRDMQWNHITLQFKHALYCL